MKTFKYTVRDSAGLHARPAGFLVKCTQRFSSSVKIIKDEKSADAKRLFAVLGLSIKQNDIITFTVEGASEEVDCATLQAFCEKNI